jgi:nucleoid DNA-binding protein
MIRSFGTFKLKKRAATQGRNPQTGGVIDIPAKNVIGFKMSTEAAGVLNRKKKK